MTSSQNLFFQNVYMTLTSRSRITQNKLKPFVVLPMIDNNIPDRSHEISTKMTTKNPGLNLFIKTWPPNRKNKKSKDDENRRPLTATLEKPTVLDIRLVKKIDMSKIKKEFLNLSALCRIPLLLKPKKGYRPLSLPPPEKKKCKMKKKNDAEDSGWEDEESVSIRSTSRIRNYKSEGEIPSLLFHSNVA